jgi:hypothetical protein
MFAENFVLELLIIRYALLVAFGLLALIILLKNKELIYKVIKK